MYAEKDSTGKVFLQSLDRIDVKIIIDCLTESLQSDIDMNPYSITRKKKILNTLEEISKIQ